MLELGEDFTCTGVHISPNASSIFRAAQCWGNNGEGQVAGQGVTVPTASSAPQRGGQPIVQLLGLAAGKAHACAFIDDVGGMPSGKKVLCWGQNSKGQTGEATTGVRPPTAVAGLDGSQVTAIAAGGEVTCAIAAGQVQCAGADDQGQLGRGAVDPAGSATFAAVAAVAGPTALAVGGSHACAIVQSGSRRQVRCWGANALGQLGRGASGAAEATAADVVAPAR